MTPPVSQQPQPLSVNNILRRNSHEELYLPPCLWTNRQPELLNSRFTRYRCIALPMNSTHDRLTPPSDSTQDTNLRKAARQLTSESDIIFKRWALTDLLEALSKERKISSQNDLKFYFGGRSVAELSAHTFYYSIDNIRIPFLAYIDSSEIVRFREESFPITKPSVPVWRIRKAKLAKLQPTSVEQDPYIVGVLIALGQARARSDNAAASQSSHTVHLLLSKCDKPRSILLYTATITTAFLRKFDQPSVFSDSSLDIRYARIPCACLEREITAIVEFPKGKKRSHDSSFDTKQESFKKTKS